MYTVKHGASPRIVKAALIGSRGTKYIDGGSLRMKLGLNSTWALFTSMGISPSARDAVTVASGGSVTLSGRIYPSLDEGAKVYLHYFYGGAWHSRAVVTTRKSETSPAATRRSTRNTPRR